MRALILMLLICNFAVAQNSFEGVNFGVSSTEVNSLRLKSSRGTISCYTHDNDILSLKYPLVNQVIYVFNNDTLYMIIMRSQSDAMKSTIKSKYGEGKTITENKMFWDLGDKMIHFIQQDGQYSAYIKSSKFDLKKDGSYDK